MSIYLSLTFYPGYCRTRRPSTCGACPRASTTCSTRWATRAPTQTQTRPGWSWSLKKVAMVDGRLTDI